MNKKKILFAIILGATLVAGSVIAGILYGVVQSNVPPVATVLIMVAAWIATILLALDWSKTD